MKKKNIGIFLAARSGSSRLPGKHFLRVNSKYNFIDICIMRLKKVKTIKKIFLCTTKKKKDNKFINVCKKHKINLFRGSSNDVLKRIIDCAKLHSIEIVARITADCPLSDPNIIDECVKLHCNSNNDYTSNVLKRSFPKGLDVEIIDLSALIQSQLISKSKHNKEHVTTYIRKSNKFKKQNFKYSKDLSNRRWTLDTIDDYLFLKKVFKYFSENILFSWHELINNEKIDKSLVNLNKD